MKYKFILFSPWLLQHLDRGGGGAVVQWPEQYKVLYGALRNSIGR